VEDPGMGGNFYDVCCEPAVYCMTDTCAYWCMGQGYTNLSVACDQSKIMESEAARWNEINQLHHPFADPTTPPAIKRLDGSAVVASASKMSANTTSSRI